jgi:predicted nuclease with TOPRIM domain
MPDDQSIRERIGDLVQEEHRLREQLARHEITPNEEQARLRSVEVELDQCWDLLRQRAAKREFGEDPESAEVRSPDVVERYRG